MAHNSIGNVPYPKVLEPILRAGECFNTTSGGVRLASASLWGRPGPTDPYAACTDLNWACLTDEHRQSLADAQYVVFTGITPLAWKMADGRWMVPKYARTELAERHRDVVVTALSWMDVRTENGNLLTP